MDCTQCKDALSAWLDGEDSGVECDALDEHLAGCAGCHRFADDAARVTRFARTAVATEAPDLVEAILAAAPCSRRPPLSTALRVLLGLVGLAQVELAVVGMLGAHGSEHPVQGIVLQGASLAHLAHESAAWNLAIGVGFLWVARRSPRASGMGRASTIDPPIGTAVDGVPPDLRPTAQYDATAAAHRRTA